MWMTFYFTVEFLLQLPQVHLWLVCRSPAHVLRLLPHLHKDGATQSTDNRTILR